MAFSQSNEAAETVLAAPPVAAPIARDAGRPVREWSSDDADQLREVLRTHQLPEPLIDRLMTLAAAPVHAKRVVDRLAVALGAHFHFLPIEESLREPMLLHGAPGAGLSTTAAKLAARFEDHQVLVVSAGTRDAAATAPLEEYLEVLGLPLVAAADTRSVDQAIAGAKGRAIVIDSGDAAPGKTAGTQNMLVLSADATVEDAVAAATKAATGGTRRMIVTRLDATPHLGATLAAADAGKLALVAASITPHFAFGLRALSPENLARRLLSAAISPERWRIVPL